MRTPRRHKCGSSSLPPTLWEAQTCSRFVNLLHSNCIVRPQVGMACQFGNPGIAAGWCAFCRRCKGTKVRLVQFQPPKSKRKTKSILWEQLVALCQLRGPAFKKANLFHVDASRSLLLCTRLCRSLLINDLLASFSRIRVFLLLCQVILKGFIGLAMQLSPPCSPGRAASSTGCSGQRCHEKGVSFSFALFPSHHAMQAVRLRGIDLRMQADEMCGSSCQGLSVTLVHWPLYGIA